MEVTGMVRCGERKTRREKVGNNSLRSVEALRTWQKMVRVEFSVMSRGELQTKWGKRVVLVPLRDKGLIR